MDEILVVTCPSCGDSWDAAENPQQMCECFTCGREYVKAFNTKKMDAFIFHLFKNCKFNS